MASDKKKKKKNSMWQLLLLVIWDLRLKHNHIMGGNNHSQTNDSITPNNPSTIYTHAYLQNLL